MAPRRKTTLKAAIEAERKRCAEIAVATMIELDGFDRFADRSHFAAFNMGRLAQTICQAILKIPTSKGKA